MAVVHYWRVGLRHYYFFSTANLIIANNILHNGHLGGDNNVSSLPT